jgi:hypothetical protein
MISTSIIGCKSQIFMGPNCLGDANRNERKKKHPHSKLNLCKSSWYFSNKFCYNIGGIKNRTTWLKKISYETSMRGSPFPPNYLETTFSNTAGHLWEDPWLLTCPYFLMVGSCYYFVYKKYFEVLDWLNNIFLDVCWCVRIEGLLCNNEPYLWYMCTQIMKKYKFMVNLHQLKNRETKPSLHLPKENW